MAQRPPGRAPGAGTLLRPGQGPVCAAQPTAARAQHADPPVLGPFSCPSCLLDLETHNGGTLAGSLFLSVVERGVPRGEEGLGPHLPTQAARTGLELWPENPTRDRSAFGGGGRGWGRRVLRSAQGHLVTPLENCDHVFITVKHVSHSKLKAVISSQSAAERAQTAPVSGRHVCPHVPRAL